MDLSQYKELWTFLISMVPVIELRGGLPFALGSGIHPVLAWILAIAGNFLPLPFILLFIRPIFKWMKKFRIFKKLVDKIEARAMNKSDKVLKYSFWGLAIFVGLPLPGTGGWTGALIAALLDMRLKRAIPSILIGLIIAATLVTIVCYLVASGATWLSWMLG